MGFFPHHLPIYQCAFRHKSLNNDVGETPLPNNERLEFLGDAILGAVVGDFVFKHYQNQPEGYLTNLRSKLVRRDTLNTLAVQIGLDKLVLHKKKMASTHNNYMNGNAFEAFIGAIYLDRGYAKCVEFINKIILEKYINLDEVEKEEQNYKSKLIEWCQRYQLEFQFVSKEAKEKNNPNSPVFRSRLLIEDIEAGSGTGYTKKESHQDAAKKAYQQINKNHAFVNKLIEAKKLRRKQKAAEKKAMTGKQAEEQAQTLAQSPAKPRRTPVKERKKKEI